MYNSIKKKAETTQNIASLYKTSNKCDYPLLDSRIKMLSKDWKQQLAFKLQMLQQAK